MDSHRFLIIPHSIDRIQELNMREINKTKGAKCEDLVAVCKQRQQTKGNAAQNESRKKCTRLVTENKSAK